MPVWKNISLEAQLADAKDPLMKQLIPPGAFASLSATPAERQLVAVLTANSEPVGAVVARIDEAVFACEVLSLALADGLVLSPALAMGLDVVANAAADQGVATVFDPVEPVTSTVESSLAEASFVPSKETWEWFELDYQGFVRYAAAAASPATLVSGTFDQLTRNQLRAIVETCGYRPNPADSLELSTVIWDEDALPVGVVVLRKVQKDLTVHWVWVARRLRQSGIGRQLIAASMPPGPDETSRFRVKSGNAAMLAIARKRRFVRRLWETRTWTHHLG